MKKIYNGKDIGVCEYSPKGRMEYNEYETRRKVIYTLRDDERYRPLNVEESYVVNMVRQFKLMREVVRSGIIVYESYGDNIFDRIRELEGVGLFDEIQLNFNFSKTFDEEIKADLKSRLKESIHPRILKCGYQYINSFISRELRHSETSNKRTYDELYRYANYFSAKSFTLKYYKKSGDFYIIFPFSSCMDIVIPINGTMIDGVRPETSTAKLFPNSKESDAITKFYVETKLISKVKFPDRVKYKSRCITTWYSGNNYFILVYDAGAIDLKMYDATEIVNMYREMLRIYNSDTQDGLDGIIFSMYDFGKVIFDTIAMDILKDGVTSLYYVGYKNLTYQRANVYHHPFRAVEPASDGDFINGLVLDIIIDAISRTWVDVYYTTSGFNQLMDINSDIGVMMNSQMYDRALKRRTYELEDYSILMNVYKGNVMVPVGFVSLCDALRHYDIDGRICIEPKRSYVSWDKTTLYKIKITGMEIIKFKK